MTHVFLPIQPEARLLGKHALLHGPVVDARERFEPGPAADSPSTHELAQPRAQHVVIVLAPGVARDDGAPRLGHGGRIRMGRVVARHASEMTERAVGSTRRGSSRSSSDSARYVISPA